MINHIVLFHWKHEATPEMISDVLTGLRGLKDRVPGILALDCGVDFSGRAQGYSHALVVRLVDRAALDAYAVDPAHRAVIDNQITPILASVLAFDFEVTPES